MESRLEMKERHRIERLLAKEAPIGLVAMGLIILFGGTALTLGTSVFWGVWYWISGLMVFSFNYLVVRRRLEELGERHHVQIESLKKPLTIEEVID